LVVSWLQRAAESNKGIGVERSTIYYCPAVRCLLASMNGPASCVTAQAGVTFAPVREELWDCFVVTKLTLNITINWLDKSKHRYFEMRAHAPRRGDILETVVAGRLVKAEVEVVFPERIVVGPAHIWIVHADEI
jgi:hypothetical protein